jgi:hypothetical protein
MKAHARLVALLIVISSTAWAGHNDYSTVGNAPTRDEPARDLFRVDTSYVFSGVLEDYFGRRFPGLDREKQDAFHGSFEYSHRFLVSGKIYLRAGIGYGRFDFHRSSALDSDQSIPYVFVSPTPVPEQLFSLNAVIGLEYMVGKDVGAFLYLYPGFYTEDHIGSSSFDMPITVGRAFVLQEERLFLILGGNAAGLRGEFPVLPIVGLIWKPSDQWNFFLVPPEPRVTYYPTKNFGIYVSGQLTGGSFRTDRDPDEPGLGASVPPQRFSNAQVDYTEYRAGGGIELRYNDRISMNLGGGYVFQRRFNFERAGDEFEADGAPYVRVGLKADF